MAERDRGRLRRTFDDVAELYDRVRPTYPEPLLDDLVSLAGLEPGSRVLEIGPGTGQATLALARRGLELVCVELGARLAATTRRKLAGFPVEVVVADFERWEPATAGFDAVVSFSAFHWLDAETRLERSARLLRPGGSLVVVGVAHVLAGDFDPVWLEVQEDYDAVVPSPDNGPPPRPDEVGDLQTDLEASGLFERVTGRRHLWDVEYTADEYVEVIGTYSPNLALDAETRARLFDRIRRRIVARPGATARKTYLAVLDVATVGFRAWTRPSAR